MRIIIAIIDTWRFDAFGLNSKGKNLTRNLDKFAKDKNFTNCYSTAPWTLPACASILTGFYPTNHNLTTHANSLIKKPISSLLGNNQFHSVAIVNNSNFAPSIGYQDYFDEYYFFGDGNPKIHNNSVDHIGPFNKAVETLKKSTHKDMFVLFHTNIVHDYYLDQNKIYCEEVGSKKINKIKKHRIDLSIDFANYVAENNSKEEFELLRERYDCSVKYMDQQIKKVLKLLNTEEDIVIIVGDHGEGFNPELYKIHHGGRVGEDLLHVPLIMSFPKKIDTDKNQLISTADIVPTILDFLKIDYSEIFDGLSAIRSNPNRTIEAEDRYYCYLPNSNRRIKKDSNRIFGLRSIIDNKTKLSRTVLDSKNIYRKFSKEDLLEETSLEINDDEKKKLQFVNLNIPDKSVVTIDLKSELDKFNLNTEHMIKLQKTLSEENSLINNSIIELHKINDTMLMRLFLQLDKFIKNIFKKLKH